MKLNKLNFHSFVMIIIASLFLLLTVLFISVLYMKAAKADSLVCFYPGVSRVMAVYSEGFDPEENKDLVVAKISISSLYKESYVDFWNGDTISFSPSLPCVKIQDKRGELTQTKRFLETIKATDVIIYNR